MSPDERSIDFNRFGRQSTVHYYIRMAALRLNRSKFNSFTRQFTFTQYVEYFKQYISNLHNNKKSLLLTIVVSQKRAR